MPVIDVSPFAMKNVILTIGLDDFAKAVSSATLTPSGGTTNWKGLKPDAVYTFAQSTLWTLDLEYAQDFSSAKSLSRYLFEHDGETVDATLDADDSSTLWTLKVSIAPGAIGGAVDAVAVATVSLGVVGKPIPTWPLPRVEDTETP